MKNTTIILVAAIFVLLGIQFAFRAAQTIEYVKGEGAPMPVAAQDYSPEKLYGNRPAISNNPAGAADSIQKLEQQPAASQK